MDSYNNASYADYKHSELKMISHIYYIYEKIEQHALRQYGVLLRYNTGCCTHRKYTDNTVYPHGQVLSLQGTVLGPLCLSLEKYNPVFFKFLNWFYILQSTLKNTKSNKISLNIFQKSIF